VYQQNIVANEKLEWKGTFNGQQVPTGIYIYMLTLEDENGRKEVLRGDFTLIR